jgi:hypothetical protein
MTTTSIMKKIKGDEKIKGEGVKTRHPCIHAHAFMANKNPRQVQTSHYETFID